MEHYKKRLSARPKVKKIAEDVALEHGVTLDEIFGRSQRARIMQARCAFWQALRDLGWSLPDIGEISDRCHTTVQSGLRHRPDDRARHVKSVAAREDRQRAAAARSSA